MHLVTADARPWLAASTARFDAIFIDAYRQPYIPFYLTTREFFASVRSHLTAGGVAIINVGHPTGSNSLEQILTATTETVFPHVIRDPLSPTNTLLAAGRLPLTRQCLLTANARLPGELRPLAAQVAGRLAAPLPGGAVYTDDRAPVEWLIDSSLLSYATGHR